MKATYLSRSTSAVVAGRRVDPELECYEADELFMFWSHTHRQPWQIGEEGEAYYAAQRKILRSEQFQRLHHNEWVSSENRFIDSQTYDAIPARLNRNETLTRSDTRVGVGSIPGKLNL